MQNRRANIRSSVFLFLLGIGCETKIYFYGCLAFSEIAVFLLAPIIVLNNYRKLRYCKFHIPILMIVGLMISMFASAMFNQTAIPYVVKTFAVMYGVLAYYVVFVTLLAQNPKGLGFVFAGAAISSIITLFAFNPEAIVSEDGYGFIGQADAEEIINGPLFWIQRVKAFGQLPIIGWYLQTPLAYSLITPILFTAFAMFVTVSGRSASLSVLFAAALIALGRKRICTMRNIGKHFVMVLLVGLVVVAVYRCVYKYAATHSILGVEAQTKYMNQTKMGDGFLALLMSGRSEFFIGLSAALERPIIGYGPYAEDKEGFMGRYLAKYANYDDYLTFERLAIKAISRGERLVIQTHSHIVGAWVHYGVFGLIFYLWLLFVIYKQLKYYMPAIPQWFGYFSLYIGVYLWHIMFSPVGSRMMLGLFISTLYIAKAVGEHRLRLPLEIEAENASLA